MSPCAKRETGGFLQKELMISTMKWVVIGVSRNLVCKFLLTSYINLHKPVVIVDNASYHNRKKEKLPTKSREEYTQGWLT
jgi:hypothetical protein